jgi:uncharacterized Zn finger protein/DNA-binding XRE family transcriptional regulator
MSFIGGWRPYVSAASRRRTAESSMAKLVKRGVAVHPIVIDGRKITRTFWGESWCQHLESFSDYANRLPRGRTYVRNGSVCHLKIDKGEVTAIVSGSALYDVKITVTALPAEKWNAVKKECAGKIGSLLELLQGKLSKAVMTLVTDRKTGLFPLPTEIKLFCSCPDWAEMCKHVAAVLYGVGARLDSSPELLFLLRAVDHEELIEMDIASEGITASGSRKRIAENDLADMFGIDIFEKQSDAASPPVSKTPSKLPSKLPSKPPSKLPSKAPLKPSPKDAHSDDRPFTGKAIKELRTLLKLNSVDFAYLIGVSVSTIDRWEKTKGALRLHPRTLTALRKVSAKY